MKSFSLTRLPGYYAVCLLPPTSLLPTWANDGDFCSVTRTNNELSIICGEDALPSTLPEGIEVARDWLLLRVEGPFAFDVTGVLAALASPLAEAGVSMLAVATYQTDYLLVRAEQMERAISALTEAGHKFQ